MTITPKFMQLVVEFPRRALETGSVSGSVEQVVENMHSTGKRWGSKLNANPKSNPGNYNTRSGLNTPNPKVEEEHNVSAEQREACFAFFTEAVGARGWRRHSQLQPEDAGRKCEGW